MRLKSLELQGYKSFASKSIFNFDSGVVAIIGPNGSGKSNVADAIRWVLGEQSYSTLRGQRTTDMIFAGSANRARMGMAHVSIVLDNSDGTLPLDYNEVTISRRAFRSGENEYYINNNRVRLKDVADVLAQGGLSRQTYTVIGQGTIDRILSLRAEDRRQLFEEAAGIIYHRRRRTDTLSKLDEARNNLIRVNDITKEIEPRLKRLENQAKKFEKQSTIRLHLDGLLKVWYGYKWGDGQEALHRARVRETLSEERLKEELEALQNIEVTIQDLRIHQMELRSQVGDWHAQSSQLHSQAEVLQRELAVGEERARQLTSQREEFLTEIDQLKETLSQHQQLVAETEQNLTTINRTYQAAKTKFETARKKLDAHKIERETFLYQKREAEKKGQQLAHALTEKESRLTQLAEQQKKLISQQEEQATAIETLIKQKSAIEENLRQCKANLAEVEKALDALAQREAEIQNKYQTSLEETKNLSNELANHEKSLASLQTRQDVLARLRTEMAGYHEGVKAVLQNKNLSGILGTPVQLIQVPPELELAFEVALGGRLQDIIVNSWEDANKAIQYLKKSGSGQATFLPLDRLRPPSKLSVPSLPGVLGLAADLVDFSSQIAPAAESMLNRLVITTDLDAAKNAFDKLQGGFQIATQTGEIVRSGGAITGGGQKNNRQGGRFLAREREWRELPAQIKAINLKIEETQTHLKDEAKIQGDIQTNLKKLAEEKRLIVASQTQVQGDINTQQNALSDRNNQIGWQEGLQTKTEAEIVANQTREGTFKAEIEQLTREREAITQAIADLEAQIERLSAETLLTELNQAQTEVTLISEKRDSQETLLRSFRQNQTQSQSRLDNRQSRVADLARQRETLQTQLTTQEEKHKVLVEQVKAYTDKIEPAEVKLKSLEAEQVANEEKETKQRALRRRLEAEHHRFSLELAHRQEALNILKRQIEDDFGMVQLELSEDQIGQPTLPLHPVVTELPIIKDPPDGIEEDIRHLKVQMRQLGHINPDAPQEYEELKTRFTFLTNQMGDLELAIDDLKKVVAELDQIMEKAFTKTYTTVAKAFQDYFKILFNGGEAQLILTEPEDITKTGIDIIARPPGKRPQNLDLLSGGERSLTAQSLIFALLKTSPTPYCVFDEVDAMLDEANVDRFREGIATLGENIQFILITHNRKTIEIADTIYGISMGDDAVSRVISRKLEDFSENGSG